MANRLAHGQAYVDLAKAPWATDGVFADALHVNADGAAHVMNDLADWLVASGLMLPPARPAR